MRHVPGQLPLLGHVLPMLRDPINFLVRTHAVGGGVARIRLGPKRAYLVTDPELIWQILVNQANVFHKGHQLEQARPVIGNSLAVTNGKEHREQRRLVQPAFHNRQLPTYTAIMTDVIKETFGSWAGDHGIDMRGHMHELSLRLVCRVLLSTELGRAAVDEIVHGLPILLRGVHRRTMIPIGFLGELPTPGNRRYRDESVRLHAAADRLIAAYRSREVDSGDLLSKLVNATDPETGGTMSDQQVHDQVMLILTAGSESVAATLTWATDLISRRPDVQARLHHEVTDALAGCTPTYADLPKLAYARAVVTETLRLYPPLLMSSRSPRTSTNLGAYRVPAGSMVLLSVLPAQRDPARYPDPDRFDPDRWRDRKPGSMPRGSFLPFNAGPSGCIGESFAWTETILVLSMLAARWTVEPTTTDPPPPRTGVTLSPAHLVVRLSPRAAA